jgi:deoxyribodipyrimidine photo-lyase
MRGGSDAARARLREFVRESLPRYVDDRNDPDAGVTSGLSPYLHFGHISTHEILAAIAAEEGWSKDALSKKGRAGDRGNVYGMSAQAEAFLDQLVTWRELGFNMCAYRSDYAEYESLPEWAKETLEEQARDPRPVLYTRRDLEEARTGDVVWNAAQRELVRDGRIHNYLRMLWGKRILEWSKTPREALETMIALNDKYAIDGRDPNSYSGIFWVMGRYDRPWGPRRPIFGTVRFMSSSATLRKVRMRGYLERYAR